jgi:hypothetical protein
MFFTHQFLKPHEISRNMYIDNSRSCDVIQSFNISNTKARHLIRSYISYELLIVLDPTYSLHPS